MGGQIAERGTRPNPGKRHPYLLPSRFRASTIHQQKTQVFVRIHKIGSQLDRLPQQYFTASELAPLRQPRPHVIQLRSEAIRIPAVRNRSPKLLNTLLIMPAT